MHENNLRAENKCLLSLRYLKRNNIFKDFILVLSDTDFFTASESILFKKALLQSKKLRVILNKKNDICSSTDNSSFTDILDFSKENDIKINFKDYENNVSNGTFFYKAQSLHSELEFICQTMKRYLLKKEYKEDDFVIFVKDVSEYSDYLKQYLNEYDISYSFLFKENKPVNTPLLNTILLLFKLVSREDLKAQTLLAYLKNGLTNVVRMDVHKLELYVKIYEPSSTELLNGFKRYKNSNENNNFLKEINRIRKKIIDPILDFKKNIEKSSNTGGYISAIKYFIENSGVKKSLKNLNLKLENTEFKNLIKNQLDVLEKVKNTLDNIDLILKNMPITIDEFPSLLESILNANGINEKYTEFLNSVKVVSIDNHDDLKDNFKVAFILGATDDFFPKIPNKLSDFFNSSEVEYIRGLGYNFTENIETRIQAENLKLNKVFNLVKEKIYVTYPQFNLNGESLKPAWFVKDAKFVDKPKKNEDLLSEKSVYGLYSEKIKGKINLSNDLIKYLKNDCKYKKTIDTLEGYKLSINYSLEKPENLAYFLNKKSKLNFSNITLSPSQIESYYSCAFKFLCEYVVNLDVIGLETFDSLKYGSFVHYVLEKIFKNYKPEEILDFSEDKLENIILEIIENYLFKSLDYLNFSTKRLENLIKRAIRILCFSVRHIANGLVNSDFLAKFFELRIGKDTKPLKINVDDSKSVDIIGKIDRIDIFKSCESDKEVNYFRIIDYKTGNKEIKLIDVLYGLNIQMLIYALCILKNENFLNFKSVKFAGVLYVPIRGKVILSSRKNSYSDEYINLEKQKKLKMNGIILKDLNVAQAMEKEIRGDYIPVVLKNDELKGNENNLISEDKIKIILDYVEYLIKNMAQKVYKADFTPNPLKGDTYDSCEYCDYCSICGITHNKELEVNIKNKSIDEIYSEMGSKLCF